VLDRRLRWWNELASRPVIVRRGDLPGFYQVADEGLWVDLVSLDEQMACESLSPPGWALAVSEVFDAASHIDREASPRFVPVAELRTAAVCTVWLLDPEMHAHVEGAAYFSPLSTVRLPILQFFTKHGIKMRCQNRGAQNMAMKRIVTRSLEQVGRAKKKVSVTNRYHGYVLACCKAWLLCSLLGNYPHVRHQDRVRDAATRRRLHELFRGAAYERWVVNLVHHAIDVTTACLREYMGHSIRHNPALEEHVAGPSMMRLPEYEAATQRGVNQLRAYFGRWLLDPASELFASFATLPPRPCSLQRYFMCGKTNCALPCPHKFMKANEVKSMPVAAPDDDDDTDELALTVALIEEMSMDRAIVVHHRRQEVEREHEDAVNERASGWRWGEQRWHTELNALMGKMEAEAASLSYSRPWKLDVLFPTAGKRAASAAAAVGDDDVRFLAEVVRRCGPARCGEPMPRVVPFFRLLGVSAEVVDELAVLVGPELRGAQTENRLRQMATELQGREPRATALLREAWRLVCEAEDHFVLQDMPPNVARAQAQAMRDVYLGLNVVDTNVCFVFCPACDTVYSHLVDDTTMYRKTFRYGLNCAAVDRRRRGTYCTTKDGKTKRVCGEALVFLPLLGRVLWWPKRRMVVAICCQPRCGRMMVLDRAAPMMWSAHGWACHRCMMTQQLAAARRFEDVEFVFSKDAAPRQCALWENHEKRLEKNPNLRFKDAQLHILSPTLYCCSKCYDPEMAEALRRGEKEEDMRTIMAAIYDDAHRASPHRDARRRRRMIMRAANQA
jgi:hypothetical protein